MEPTLQADRSNLNNKPDSIIRDNKQGTCMSIDGAIPADRNVVKKEAENILKYKDLTVEIHCLWFAKAKVMPVMTGGTGTISK